MSPRVALVSILGLCAAACGDSLVGGSCLPGYHPAPNGGCVVDESLPTANDGAGPADDAAPRDDGAVATDAPAGDGATPADGMASCNAPSVLCEGTCTDLSSDPSHCGACGHHCAVGEVCALGNCVSNCPPPTVDCGGRCIDVESDADHCGACGNVCPTGLCNAGVCRDARAGHVVLLGHGFERSRPDQDRVLANAVFLAPSNPARVLAFEAYADTTVGGDVARIDAAITRAASGRPWSKTTILDAESVPRVLAIDRYDVILVYPQPLASDEEISAAALAMGGALASFARAGGVVVVVDGATSNAGTYPFANATGFLSIRGEHPIDGQPVDLTAAVDALAVGVATTYRAESVSVAFDTDDPHAVFAWGSEPVVLHRAVVP